MSARRISLVCFDMAGTTVSDGGVVEGAFLDALTARGVGPADERRPAMLDYVRDTMGSSKITVFRALFPDGTEAESANAAFEAAYEDRVEAGDIAEIPGAADVIGALRADGVRVALLTGFSARTRDRVIDALGWADIADLLVTPEEAGRGRPYPDMVLHAVLRLGIDDVADVAVVGDTTADVLSGRRSGASLVVGVLSGFDSAEQLHAAGATHVVNSVIDVPSLLESSAN
jgi:phosphoglycolate phosphatase